MRRHRKTMYGDPILKILGRLPVIDNERWVKSWQSERPNAVYRFRRWYTENDGRTITLLRAVTTISPATLLWLNLNIAWVLTAALIGVFVIEILSEKREGLKREQWKDEFERERREDDRERRASDPLV